MLRHTAFFDALESRNEFSNQWRSVLAGLLVLRLVDAWLDFGGDCPTASTEVGAVREAISNISNCHPVAHVLRDIVDRVEQTAHPRLDTVATAVLNYATMLDIQCEWALAHDVLDSLFQHARLLEDLPTTIRVGLALSKLERSMGCIHRSDEILPIVEECATRLRDDIAYLRVQIGRVYSHVSHGRFRDGLAQLDTITDRIDTSGDDYLRVCAAHLRLDLGWRMKTPDDALRHGYQALELTGAGALREGLLNGIAASHMVARRYDAAQTILTQLLHSTAPEFTTVALANLAEIALAQSNQKLFDYYQNQVQFDQLIPSERPHFHYVTATAHRRFGRHRQAIEAMREARYLARQYDSHRTYRQATRRLKEWGIRPE